LLDGREHLGVGVIEQVGTLAQQRQLGGVFTQRTASIMRLQSTLDTRQPAPHLLQCSALR